MTPLDEEIFFLSLVHIVLVADACIWLDRWNECRTIERYQICCRNIEQQYTTINCFMVAYKPIHVQVIVSRI